MKQHDKEVGKEIKIFDLGSKPKIVASKRIGISFSKDLLWRFYIKYNRFVSRDDMVITRDFVSVAYIVKDKKVLLIKHKKIGLWLPPGGHIDKNETPEQATIREIKEETGLDIILDTKKFHKIQILKPHHIEIHPINEGHEHICFTYFTKPIGGKMIQNLKETNGFKWFSKKELDSNEVTIEVKTFAKQAIDGVK